ncbi:MAG: helix-turn-helix transcriptional regulator [Clostridia bacterium]|nr:helix-turn-helix transcriptional regulator [Clostridia bacterium]
MNKQSCRFSNDTGDAKLTVYRVFPGAEITFHSIHMDELSWESRSAADSREGSSHLLEIHHCREGRMQEAAQLLIHTDRPIGEIAEMSGYTNASKFAAAFQDVMGETPREFRQAHTQQRK